MISNDHDTPSRPGNPAKTTNSATTLGDCATFISSKNAGPFLITVDVVFSSRESYELIRDTGLITPERVAELYGRDVADIVGIYFVSSAKALKVTMRRSTPSGSPGDTDVYGAQQHVPLMTLPLQPQPAAGMTSARERGAL